MEATASTAACRIPTSCVERSADCLFCQPHHLCDTSFKLPPYHEHITMSSARFLSIHRKKLYDKIIRVDHAGELGADRIYMGQMAVLRKDLKNGPIIQQMWDQEKEHLTRFEGLVLEHRSSKSLLSPLWSVGGFLLGAGSALLGPKSAMACTVAVENVISEHYNDQIRQLIADDPVQHKDLIELLSKFRDDEEHHHQTGLENKARDAFGYIVLSKGIQFICRTAIKVAERI